MQKKGNKSVGKICVLVLCSTLALLLLAWGGLNLAKFAIYADYYGCKTDVCINPGLTDGFVCQGICYASAADKILVSGYMMNGSASRIYVTDTDDNSYYVSIHYGSDKIFTGHAGGIAVSGDRVYVASGSKLYVIPLADILAAQNGGVVKTKAIIPVNNDAAFVFANEDYIYVGEYHDGKNICTDHPHETADGTYNAILTRYTRAEMENYDKTDHPDVTPDKIYSIRNSVQGICVTPNGKVVLSTSYGIASTEYFVYNEVDATPSGAQLDGVEVFDLCSPVRYMRGPSMGEDLEWYNGKVLTLTESASDKYLFGKLFFANKIVALELDE